MSVSQMCLLLLVSLIAGCDADIPPLDTDAGKTDSGSALVIPSDRTSMSCRFDAQPVGVVPLLQVVAAEKIEDIDSVRAVYTDVASESVLLVNGDHEVLRWKPGSSVADPVLDLRERGQRIVDLVTAKTGELFILLTSATGTEVVRFSADGERFVPESGLFVLHSKSTLGALAFDEHGYLMVALADTTEDPLVSTNAVDAKTREGVVSRLDISTLDETGDYAIPNDNPSYGEVTETYATGARKPFSCDQRSDGQVWCADRGAKVDELHRVDARRNLGWPTYDGRECARNPSCDLQLDLFPQSVLERTRQDCGMTPGVFWHGEDEPRTDDMYVYVDTCESRVHGVLTKSPDRIYWSGVVAEAPSNVVAVFRSFDGTPLLISAEGQVYRMSMRYENAFPTRLSETGCFEEVTSLRPAAGVIPYAVNAPLWTDGAAKQRHFELPPGEALEANPSQWTFPVGTVVLKSFSYPLRAQTELVPVETRAMIRRPYGWEFHSYRWLEDGSDAMLLESGETRELESFELETPELVEHTFPSRSACITCHGREGAQTIGLRTDQLDRAYAYGAELENQLTALDAARLVDGSSFGNDTPMPNPYDEEASLDLRARAYLHTNCAHCHRPGGWVPSNLTMDLRYDTALQEAEICNVRTSFGFGETYRIRPGDPEDSRILARMNRRDFEQMPPLATSIVDQPGVELIREWISNLEDCESP